MYKGERRFSAESYVAQPPPSLLATQVFLDGLLEFTGRKFMQGTGNERLVGHSFFGRLFLNLFQIARGQVNGSVCVAFCLGLEN